jgi:rRNA processing
MAPMTTTATIGTKKKNNDRMTTTTRGGTDGPAAWIAKKTHIKNKTRAATTTATTAGTTKRNEAVKAPHLATERRAGGGGRGSGRADGGNTAVVGVERFAHQRYGGVQRGWQRYRDREHTKQLHTSRALRTYRRVLHREGYSDTNNRYNYNTTNGKNNAKDSTTTNASTSELPPLRSGIDVGGQKQMRGEVEMDDDKDHREKKYRSSSVNVDHHETDLATLATAVLLSSNSSEDTRTGTQAADKVAATAVGTPVKISTKCGRQTGTGDRFQSKKLSSKERKRQQQQEQQQQQQRKEEQERKLAREHALQKRRNRHRLLTALTSKGQPVMKNIVQDILDRLTPRPSSSTGERAATEE